MTCSLSAALAVYVVLMELVEAQALQMTPVNLLQHAMIASIDLLVSTVVAKFELAVDSKTIGDAQREGLEKFSVLAETGDSLDALYARSVDVQSPAILASVEPVDSVSSISLAYADPHH